MKRRGRGFFYQNTRRQVFIAAFFAVVSSVYIWFPTWQRLEHERKAVDGKTPDVKKESSSTTNKNSEAVGTRNSAEREQIDTAQ